MGGCYRNYSRELGLLRAIVRAIEVRPLKLGVTTQDDLAKSGFSRSRGGPLGEIGILVRGEKPFRDLSKALFEANDAIFRGAPFKEYQSELFGHLLELNFGKDPSAIGSDDVRALEEEMLSWFKERSESHLVFVACCLSRRHSPDFNIGPVHFSHYETLRGHQSELSERTDFTSPEFEQLLSTMLDEGAFWLAAIELHRFDLKRGLEIANLAIDLAIVAIQLAAPYLGTENMSRLDSRRGTGRIRTLAVSDNGLSVSQSNLEPGVTIREGFLVDGIISKNPALVSAVGNLVKSFASGNFRLKTLEQAWCDAAYWLHQGLAESMDTIAVTKLETAIEVLMRAESTQGSEKRILKSLEIFFGLKRGDRINPNSDETTAEFSKSIVSGRSKILHGTSSTLLENVSALRARAEYLASRLVHLYAVELERYILSSQAIDAIDPFLDWIKSDWQSRKFQRTSN